MTERQSGKHRQPRAAAEGIVAVQGETDTLTEHDAAPDTTVQVESESTAPTKTCGADDDPPHDAGIVDSDATRARHRINRARLLPYALLPALGLLLAVAAGYLKWQDVSADNAGNARIESEAAAKEAAVALLSYKPDTAEQTLGSAGGLLTGTFRESYQQLTRDVVIPGAKQKHISSVATVPAVASVSATPRHAVVLLFVNQTMVVGTDAPSDTVSSVRMTLDKVNGRWLVADFDPI